MDIIRHQLRGKLQVDTEFGTFLGDTRIRLLEVLRSHYHNDANTIAPTEGLASAARAIAGTNILHADFLADASRTEVVDYHPMPGGYFRREWSMLDDSAVAQRMPDLFHPEPAPKRDEVPVHYAALAANALPTLAGEAMITYGAGR